MSQETDCTDELITDGGTEETPSEGVAQELCNPPQCEVDGCTEQSDYLLVSGDLCADHAAEAEPETVALCQHVLGMPGGGSGE